jgi:hypothetical protein
MSGHVVNTLIKNAFTCYNKLARLQVKFSEEVARKGHFVTIHPQSGRAMSTVTGNELSFGGKCLACKTVGDAITAEYTSDIFTVPLDMTGPLPCRYILGHFLHVLADVAADPDQISIALSTIISVITHFNTVYTSGKNLDRILVDTEAADNLALKTAECDNLREKVKKLEEELEKRGEHTQLAGDMMPQADLIPFDDFDYTSTIGTISPGQIIKISVDGVDHMPAGTIMCFKIPSETHEY